MRILLVDDHTLFREALLHVLKRFDPAAVIIEAASAPDALRLAGHYHDLDLILLDLKLPEVDGFAVLPQLLAAAATTPVVVLSASENPADVRRALAAGAAGYVPKTCTCHELLNALRLIMAGEVYVPPSLLAALDTAAPPADIPPEDAAGLTPRQLDVLRLMGLGLANKVIARRLDVAEGTVKLHVAAIMHALHVHNRTHAVIEAARRGLIPPANGH
ncbi:MAG: response regulator transcription factor [Pseudomonadota bacterium]|nr:response regulator transcription factor [Pseudomonadota bacterium]